MPQNSTRAKSLSNAFAERLGERLRALRGDATLRAFAPTVGLDARALHRIERGEQNVTLATLAAVCEALGCRAGDLIDEKTALSARKKSSAKKKTAPPKRKPS